MATTYADKVNSEYKHSTSHFVSLRERLAESMVGANELTLTAMVSEFKRRFKQWTKFTDMHICKAIMVPMDKILIDTTMQRSVNFTHILNIMNSFAETMVMAIQVYEDPEKPGHYIAWDGQHTAIVLYILATKVFGERIANLMVPVVVYSVKQKAEIRRNFILLNGEAKSMLEFIDLWKQMVHGVLTDGADDPVWVKAAEKQAHLARAGLFATHKKFMDDKQPGAFTLLANTICSDSPDTLKDVAVTRMFCDYWIAMKALTGQERHVDAKEARQLYEYFHLCHQQNINVDDKYIIEFTQFAKDYFECDWSAGGAFWDKTKTAYENWYAKNNPEDVDLVTGEQKIRGFSKEFTCGGPFLIAQLKESTKLKLPTIDSAFIPAKKDLW
jgi:hypothetical protein